MDLDIIYYGCYAIGGFGLGMAFACWALEKLEA